MGPRPVGGPGTTPSCHVVAVFAHRDEALQALGALAEAGFSADERSFLARQEPGDTVDPLGFAPHFDPAEVSAEEGLRQAEGVVKEGIAGTAVGTALGLIAGAVALAIPGVGPAVSVGIWAYVLGGAAVGATAGAVVGALSHRWEIRYQDLVTQGRVLVGVHVNNDDRANQAALILEASGPEDVETFDNDGQLR
jgi:hypothetical protein